MIQYLFQINKIKHMDKMNKNKKIKSDHRFVAFKKLKNKIKIL